MVENAPIHKVKAGNISCPVWKQERELNGNKMEFLAVGSPQKTYKDGEEWKHTYNLNENDVPKAILCLQEAYKWVKIEYKKQQNEE